MESENLPVIRKENPVEESMRLLKDLMNAETPMATDDDLKQLMAVQAAFLHSLGVGLMSTCTKGAKLDRGKMRLAFKAFDASRLANESALRVSRAAAKLEDRL